MIKRIWSVVDDRTGLSQMLGPVLSHPVPPARGWVAWSYALGSGVLAAFMIQVVTGIALASVYVPSTGQAYESLVFITDRAALGSLLRGIHNFGATMMIIFIGLHMIQTFLVAAYKYPREATWLSGTVLLVLTLGLAFTGQLLRWDQTAYWSVFVLTEMVARVPLVGHGLAQLVLAGNTVGAATLTRFYSFHVFFIPALVFVFIGFHLWLIVHHGVSEPPEAGQPVDPRTYKERYHAMLERKRIPFWPDAVWRDVVLAVGLVAVIVLLAVAVGPPRLEKPPDPTVLEAYPRPDWYFLWIFSVLALLPGGLEDWAILGGPVIFGVMLVMLPFVANKGDRSPKQRPWAIAVVMIAVIMLGTLYVEGRRSPWSPNFNAQPLQASALGTSDPVIQKGALVFNQKGCQACHSVAGQGGQRGPDLTFVGDRLTENQLTLRIINGGRNMPAYAGNVSPEELRALVAFLHSRKAAPVGTTGAQAQAAPGTR